MRIKVQLIVESAGQSAKAALIRDLPNMRRALVVSQSTMPCSVYSHSVVKRTAENRVPATNGIASRACSDVSSRQVLTRYRLTRM